MGTNEIILKRVQAAIEVTRGTDLPATRKVYAQIAGNYERPLGQFQDTTGTFEGRRRAVYGRSRATFTGTDLATYEDLPWWLQMALKGGVTGVSDVGTPTPSYAYTFVPSLATDDLKSFVMEHGEPSNAYQSRQVMVNSWTMRMDTDSDDEPGWMFEAEMLGLDWTTTTYTGALSDRTTEPIRAAGTKVYVDTATIGTTQRLGWLISASITGNNAIHYKAFSEDVDSFAANKVGRGLRTFDAQLVVEFEDDVEFANFRSVVPVQRKIRLEQTGSEIHSGTPTVTKDKKMTLDILGYWSGRSEADREGNMTASLSLTGFYDAAFGGTFKAVVNNALITLP